MTDTLTGQTLLFRCCTNKKDMTDERKYGQLSQASMIGPHIQSLQVCLDTFPNEVVTLQVEASKLRATERVCHNWL